MFAFLRSIRLRPIEWSRAVVATGEGSPYIGRVLESALANASAIVVLMTPDEIAYLRDHHSEGNDDQECVPRLQARPNVLFEAGMAMARDPDKTIIVEMGPMRSFSEITGRHTVRIDNKATWRQDLAERLRSAGCSVDTTGGDWLTAGVFSLALTELAKSPTFEAAPLTTIDLAQPSQDPSGDTIWGVLSEEMCETGLDKHAVARGSMSSKYMLTTIASPPGSLDHLRQAVRQTNDAVARIVEFDKYPRKSERLLETLIAMIVLRSLAPPAYNALANGKTNRYGASVALSAAWKGILHPDVTDVNTEMTTRVLIESRLLMMSPTREWWHPMVPDDFRASYTEAGGTPDRAAELISEIGMHAHNSQLRLPPTFYFVSHIEGFGSTHRVD